MSDNQLAKIKAGNLGVQLTTLEGMRDTANILAQSGLLPAGYGNTAQVFAGIQYGAELGLRPMTALNSIAIIKGKPTLYGDAALAMVKTSGLLTAYSEEIEGVGMAMVAKVMSEREGKFKISTTFSVDDAKTAGLWCKTGPWKTHPKRMLKYKARAFNLRDNFPDILKGMHLQEEMVGEVDEPMAKPECDVAPRHDRRKKVVSEQSPPPKDPAEPVTTDFAGVGEQELPIELPVEVAGESSVSAGNVIEVEVVNTDEAFDNLMQAYKTAGGTDFTEWAAEALRRDVDEVDGIEKFDSDMIGRLGRHLESEGV